MEWRADQREEEDSSPQRQQHDAPPPPPPPPPPLAAAGDAAPPPQSLPPAAAASPPGGNDAAAEGAAPPLAPAAAGAQQQRQPPPPRSTAAGAGAGAAATTSGAGGGWQDYSSVFTAAKAGMAGVDRDRVKRITYELSKDSAHFREEQRKQRAADEKAARLCADAARLPAAALAAAERAADAKVAALEAGRDLSRAWLHVDMDAFYAAVEERDAPRLKGVPMAVGSTSMITTANYAARAFGVRSAMPGFIALRLCPQLVLVPCNFDKYRAASEQVRAVLREFDPHFRPASLDEAYLDVTDYVSARPDLGGPAGAAAELRARVRAATGGLTCSVGAAPNQMLAKICSDINKPDGQFVLPPTRAAVLEFVRTLPARRVPGIGRATEQLAAAVGVRTCGDAYERRGLLAALFSPTALDFFLSAALGLGEGSTRGWRAGGWLRGWSHHSAVALQSLAAN